MSSNSEARKRQAAIEAATARFERRREATQQALETIMSGADFTDADAFLIALADAGARVEIDG